MTPEREYRHCIPSVWQRWHPERSLEHPTYMLAVRFYNEPISSATTGGWAEPCGSGMNRTSTAGEGFWLAQVETINVHCDVQNTGQLLQASL